MHADPNSTYDPRVHGMTVRATSIANTVNATRVGAPHPELSPPLPGWTPIALQQGFWATQMHDGVTVIVTIGSGGTLLFAGTDIGRSIQPLGIAQGAIAAGDSLVPLEHGLSPVLPVCGAAPPPSADLCGLPTAANGYVPVYDVASNVVTGFGFLASMCIVQNSTDVQITARFNHIACANATGVGVGGANQLGATSLLAPAIAR
jgi:hypothetical protein